MKILFYIVIVFNLFEIQICAQDKTGCTAEACHISLISKKNIHPVILDDCFTCHEGDEANHPIGQGNEFKLSENSPSLCYICHDDINVNESTKSVHPPFEEDCLSCHNPHSTENKFLVNDKTPDLCFACHDDPNNLENVSSIHSVINTKKNCINCHSPHNSAQSNLLFKEEKELCLNCHNREIEIEKGDKPIQNIGIRIKVEEETHPPVIDGCSSCHNPHSSKEGSLLLDRFPIGKYANGFEGNYNLCFSCHDESSFKENTKNSSTNFKNGNINLHFIHVNNEKSRSCTNCHDVHGSKVKHFIKNVVRFGKWEMKMNYLETETGSSCLPGCHAYKKYNQ